MGKSHEFNLGPKNQVIIAHTIYDSISTKMQAMQNDLLLLEDRRAVVLLKEDMRVTSGC